MARQQTRIAELAAIISTRTTEIDDYLNSTGTPTPSFSQQYPSNVALPPHLQKSRDDILVATEELQALISGPMTYLNYVVCPKVNVLGSLQFIHRYKIASKVALGEEVPYQELSQRCNVDESDCRRFMRMAIAYHIFLEPRKGFVTHSSISRLLVDMPLLNQWLAYIVDESYPTGSRTVDALQRWPGSQEPDECGFSLIHPGGGRFFDSLKGDPMRGKRFDDNMTFLKSLPYFSFEFLAKDLGWETEGCPKVLVDVGGSHGPVAKALLMKYPEIERCVVQDLPETVQTASVPDDLKGRLEFEAHDFFVEQTVRDADVYLLRSTLHDWSDKYAKQIIANLIPALKKGAKIVANEVVLPEPNAVPSYHAQLLRGFDLAMKGTCNAKERDADEWEELFTSVDERFKLERISCSPGSVLSVIQFVWKGE